MLAGRRIALVEDDEFMGASIVQRLELEGAEVVWLKLMVRGVAAIRTPRRPIDAVVCDIRLPDGTGEELFRTLCRTMSPPPFLFITGQGGIDQAVRLLRSGAADYVTKPFEMGRFLERLALILKPRAALDLPPQTGISAAARAVDRQVSLAAAHDRPVLIRGAIGTGKGRLARHIHDRSERQLAGFVEVNVLRDPDADAALVRALAGIGEGTLYLNGLGRLAPVTQERLMAALADAAPFRVIASAGTRIEEKVADGAFRPDLLYLFQSHELVVPPLAERPEDAVWLAAQLFDPLNARRPQPLHGISALAETALRAHDWPGNGRELRARMERGVEAAGGDWLFPADLFPEHGHGAGDLVSLSEARDAAEKAQIIAALERSVGQVAEAARLLKVSRTTLWEKMQKFGL